MPKFLDYYHLGQAAIELREKHGRDGYLEVAVKDPRLLDFDPRWIQDLVKIADACDRCGITAGDLEQHSKIKIGSVRNRVKLLQAPPEGAGRAERAKVRRAALAQLVAWSTETAREAMHKGRNAAHASFSDAVAVVMRPSGKRWTVTFAVERGLRNADCRVLTDLGVQQAMGFVAGVGWSARSLVLQVHGASPGRDLASLLALVETSPMAIGTRDRRSTPAGALRGLRVKAARASLATVCEAAGWPMPKASGLDVERAMCLLVTARGVRRGRGRRDHE